MRIGIILDHSFYDPFGYSIRPREIATNLAELGYKVHIFSPVDKTTKINDNLFIHGVNKEKNSTYLQYLNKFTRSLFKDKFFSIFMYNSHFFRFLANRLFRLINEDIFENTDVIKLNLGSVF